MFSSHFKKNFLLKNTSQDVFVFSLFCCLKNIYIVSYISVNVKKYHVFAPMGRFQLESIYLYFPPSSQLLYSSFQILTFLLKY